MKGFCNCLARTIDGICLMLLLAIMVSLSAQIFWRYVLDQPLQHTDEIAQLSLTSIAFLGAASLYRKHGHIKIDFFADLMPKRAQHVTEALLEIVVIFSVVLIAWQILDVSDKMTRVTYGSFPDNPFSSKFALLFMPLFFGCLATVIFAVEGFFHNLARAKEGGEEQ